MDKDFPYPKAITHNLFAEVRVSAVFTFIVRFFSSIGSVGRQKRLIIKEQIARLLFASGGALRVVYPLKTMAMLPHEKGC
jgi:hypothetical protein